jgi:hypothetical protein
LKNFLAKAAADFVAQYTDAKVTINLVSIADIAASIDKSCNAAIDEGYATSRVHE